MRGSAERQYFGLRSYYELYADCRIDAQPSSVVITVSSLLHAALWLGTGLVFLLAAAGHLWLSIGIIKKLQIPDVILFVAILVPTTAALASGIYILTWRRECRVSLEVSEVIFRERRWGKWSETTVLRSQVEARTHPYWAWRGYGADEGHLLQLHSPLTMPLILARGRPDAVEKAATAFNEQTGIVTRPKQHQ